MKGGLAALMLSIADLQVEGVRCRLGIVPDEESEEEQERGGDLLLDEGFSGDFAITGEPTDMLVGVAAKGVYAMRINVAGRAAHGATPWLGQNAILRAIEVFREIESLPFAQESSELYDRPSINLGRILGGDALNKVPDACVIDVDVRYLPEQDPDAILQQVPRSRRRGHLHLPSPAGPRRPRLAVRLGAARRRVAAPSRRGHHDRPPRRLRRRLVPQAGIPAVEFGPLGAGHHGPDEWVSIPSLASYRRTISDFVRHCPAACEGGPLAMTTTTSCARRRKARGRGATPAPPP